MGFEPPTFWTQDNELATEPPHPNRCNQLYILELYDSLVVGMLTCYSAAVGSNLHKGRKILLFHLCPLAGLAPKMSTLTVQYILLAGRPDGKGGLD